MIKTKTDDRVRSFIANIKLDHISSFVESYPTSVLS